jgi:hypothetical protein
VPASPAPGRARSSYRAPGSEDLGPCYATVHHHTRGIVYLDHARRQRHVIADGAASETDAAFFARLERELRQQ